MYVHRAIAHNHVAVEFLDGDIRYRVAAFGPVSNLGVLHPELRAREYADWCNRQYKRNEDRAFWRDDDVEAGRVDVYDERGQLVKPARPTQR